MATALITHAHSDHARAGSKHYFAAADNVPLLGKRLGDSLDVAGLDYGEYRTELYPRATLQIGVGKAKADSFTPPEGHPDHGSNIAAF